MCSVGLDDLGIAAQSCPQNSVAPDGLEEECRKIGKDKRSYTKLDRPWSVSAGRVRQDERRAGVRESI